MADFDKVILNGTTYTIPSGGGSTSLTAGSLGTGIQAGNNLLEITQAPDRYNPVYVYIYFYNTYGNVIDHLCFKTSVSNQIVTWDSQEYTGNATIVSRIGNGLIYSLSSLPSGYDHYSIYYSFTYYDTVVQSGLEAGGNYFATHTITDQSTTVTSYLEKKSVATSPTVEMYGLGNDGTVTRSVQTFDEFGNVKNTTDPLFKMSTKDFGRGESKEIKFTKMFIDAQWVLDNYSDKLVFTDDNADTPQTITGNTPTPLFAIKAADEIDAQFGDLMYSISYTDGSGNTVSGTLSVMLQNMGETQIECSCAIGGQRVGGSTTPGGSVILRLDLGTYTNFTITPDIMPMSYGIVDYLVFTNAGTTGAVGQEFDSWQSDVMKTLRGLDEKEDVTASGLVDLNNTKQDTLVSGTNIKTINNESILGSGNITIQGGGSSYTAGEGIDITNDVISADTAEQNKVIASALVELHNDKADKNQLNNYQLKGDYQTGVQVDAKIESYSRSETEAINVEKVDAAALTDLNTRVAALEAAVAALQGN